MNKTICLSKRDHLILWLVAVVMMTLVSCCSPLYPTNPWCDANIYFTIGKQIWNGMVPFRDIYDQKGPVLYAIHALGALVSGRTYLGIWLMSIVCCAITMLQFVRTVGLWTSREVAMPVGVAMSFVMYCSIFYSYGDSAEEWCLPWLTWSWYLFLRYAKLDLMPSRWESIGLGLGIAFIFWNKFTVIGLYGGAALATLIIAYRRQQMAEIGRLIALALAGFGLLTCLIILYFILHHALWDMIEGYFLFNTLYYNISDQAQMQMPDTPWLKIGYLIGCMLLLLVPDRRGVKLMTALGVASCSLIFILAYCNSYYYIILFIFLPLFGMGMKRWSAGWLLHTACALVILISLVRCYNLEQLRRGDIHSAATSMAEIINQDEEASVLVYNELNTAIFVQTDCTPLVRYFFRPNSQIPTVMQEQNDCLYSRRAKYVITPDVLPDSIGYQLIGTDYDDNRLGIAEMIRRERKQDTLRLYQRAEY